MVNEISALLFVYNARSGFFNKLTDITHKIVSPSTYTCDLCSLTHDNFGEKKAWRTYLKKLNRPVEVLYKDQFELLYEKVHTVPAILVRKGQRSLEVLISAEELQKIKTIEELIERLEERLSTQ